MTWPINIVKPLQGKVARAKMACLGPRLVWAKRLGANFEGDEKWKMACSGSKKEIGRPSSPMT